MSRSDAMTLFKKVDEDSYIGGVMAVRTGEVLYVSKERFRSLQEAMIDSRVWVLQHSVPEASQLVKR